MEQSNSSGRQRLAGFAVLAGATIIAFLSARPFAGGWNDGTRLATVECLVDYHTLSIDRSIFVSVPESRASTLPTPYPPDDLGLMQNGTGDKLLINGQFYSDKSPVPAVLMAGVYQLMQFCTGVVARERPDLFSYAMTVTTSGLAYVVAVWCTFRLCGEVGLRLSTGLGLTASFALATTALPYLRHVNNHILLLGVTAPLMLGVARLSAASNSDGGVAFRLIALGSLAGFGYTLDLGAGPVLLMCTGIYLILELRRFRPVMIFALAVLPWLVFHHTLNYAVGGTFKPANANSEYFNWPGCSFNPQNMTGAWTPGSIGHCVIYALALLEGKKGFLGHNLALFLVLPAIYFCVRRRLAELPKLLYALCCCSGVWLAYALTSNNYSGACCSVRWFVPLLAPAYYLLAVFVREKPAAVSFVLTLSGWGAVMAAIMWSLGPWWGKMVPFYWQLHGAALMSLVAVWRWRFSQVVSIRSRNSPESALPLAA